MPEVVVGPSFERPPPASALCRKKHHIIVCFASRSCPTPWIERSPFRQTTLFSSITKVDCTAPMLTLPQSFLDRKMQEGKHYYVYMTAAANKFLRIYYGIVMAYLEKL